jgi:drug/metabolite transporter (DMT)-like permease
MNAMQGARGQIVVGLICGLGAALIWAGWSVATRFAVTTSLSSYDVTFLRFGVSALFLWPILVKNGIGFAEMGTTRALVMLAGAGVPFMLLASIGIRYAPASHIATLMIGAMPIFVAILSLLFYGERFSRLQVAGLLMVITGIVCIGGYSLLMARLGGEWRGDLLFLFCGLLFASYTVTQRRSGISPWHATALVNVFSAILFAPVYFLFLQPKLFTARPQEVLFQALAQGIGVAVLGMVFYAEAVRRLGAPRAAIFGALVPVLAALIGIPVLNEIPSGLTVTGIALVMTGVLIVVSFSVSRPAPGKT